MQKRRYGFFLLASLLILLMTIPSACVMRPKRQQDASPHSSDSDVREGEGSGDTAGEEKSENGAPLVIKSTNPVVTDSQKILDELDKEVSELLKDLDQMDDINDSDLNL